MSVVYYVSGKTKFIRFLFANVDVNDHRREPVYFRAVRINMTFNNVVLPDISVKGIRAFFDTTDS